MTVYFYDKAENALLRFAVMIAKYNGKYIFCKHKERDTLELPADIVKMGKQSMKPPAENYKKKPVRFVLT